jgi:hypothetical protein
VRIEVQDLVIAAGHGDSPERIICNRRIAAREHSFENMSDRAVL